MDYWVFNRGQKTYILTNVPDDYPTDTLTTMVRQLQLGTHVFPKKKDSTDGLEIINFDTLTKLDVGIVFFVDKETAQRLRTIARLKGIPVPVLCSFVMKAYSEILTDLISTQH